MLYGSKKEGQKHSYKVTKVYDAKCKEISLEEGLNDYRIYDMNEDEINIKHNVEYYLPRILSIVGFGRPYVDVKSNLEQPLKARIEKEQLHRYFPEEKV